MKSSGLYKYLEDTGVLETGTPQQIAAERKRYWKEVRKQWALEKRRSQKQCLVEYEPKEHDIIKKAAKKHKRSVRTFIREASLAYCTGDTLTFDPLYYPKLHEQVVMAYNAIAQLSDEGKIPRPFQNQVVETLVRIEQEISSCLRQQHSLKTLINDR